MAEDDPCAGPEKPITTATTGRRPRGHDPDRQRRGSTPGPASRRRTGSRRIPPPARGHDGHPGPRHPPQAGPHGPRRPARGHQAATHDRHHRKPTTRSAAQAAPGPYRAVSRPLLGATAATPGPGTRRKPDPTAQDDPCAGPGQPPGADHMAATRTGSAGAAGRPWAAPCYPVSGSLGSAACRVRRRPTRARARAAVPSGTSRAAGGRPGPAPRVSSRAGAEGAAWTCGSTDAARTAPVCRADARTGAAGQVVRALSWAQTTRPPLAAGRSPQASVRARTRARPRPLSSSTPASRGVGPRGPPPWSVTST